MMFINNDLDSQAIAARKDLFSAPRFQSIVNIFRSMYDLCVLRAQTGPIISAGGGQAAGNSTRSTQQHPQHAAARNTRRATTPD
jgi:hypothetical protein